MFVSYLEIAFERWGQQPHFCPTPYLYLFENGAALQADSTGCYTLHDPPTHPTKLLKAKRDYLLARLRYEINAFDIAKRYYMEQGSVPRGAASGSREDVIAEFKRRQTIITELKQRLVAMETELQATPEFQHGRELEEARQQQIREHQAHIAEVQSIKV